MKYLNRLIDELLTWKWAIFFILIFLFGRSQRQHLLGSSVFIQAPFNQWDILIGVTSDPFILLYLVLPVVLLLSCLSIRRIWDMNWLIRVQSWSKWVVYSAKIFIPTIVVSVSLLFIASILLTAGMHYQADWSSFSRADLSTFNYLSSFSWQSNLAPYVVLILQMCLLIIYLLALHAAIAAGYLFFSNLFYLGSVSFIILLYNLLSFRYFFSFPKLIAFNYMTFPSSYGTYNAIYPPFLVLALILIISIYVVPLLKKWRL
ncbi:hypothetical protein D3C81_287760 [compost metagenome]